MTKNKRSPTLGETEQSPKRYKSDTLSVRLDDPFADDSSKENDTVDAHVALARSRVLERLSEKSIPRRLHGLDSQRDKLKSLLQQTIKMGESNSCLIIGNRGTGKTALVRNVLQDLEKEYNNDAESGFYVVRLNGQTETSDRLALAEIAKQLFAKQQQVEQSLKGRTFSSFADSFEYMLSLLKSGDKSTLPIIFILEEFDLFAQQPKQALLYNLFDAAQSAQSPMSVIGLTCRLDVLLLLEKRVKSRFSHRQIYHFPPAKFGDFLELAKDSLRLSLQLGDSAAYSRFVEKFNSSIENLFQDGNVTAIVRRIFDLTRNIRMFYKLCFEPVSKLDSKNPFLTAASLSAADVIQRADSKTEILKGVSILEIILIVAMKKLLEKDITTFNFEMVYDEYKDFMKQAQVQGSGFGMKLYKRPVALKAFENLQALEIVCPTEEVAKCPKEYRMTKLMLEQAQVTEAVLKYMDCPTTIKKWATGAA
ncbi:hypothetical protein VTP01DRAFT_7321 [Rhizomucor pusillus]|uniref:uncharacterized protein n=1 Tax=Rhizomucor pusillus TaxID=4840 RepID=UPI0037443834